MGNHVTPDPKPTEGKRPEGPSDRRDFVRVSISAQHAPLLTALLILEDLAQRLPRGSLLCLHPPPFYIIVFLNQCLIHFLKLITVYKYFWFWFLY